MITVMVAINFIAALGVPLLVEAKAFDPCRERRAHIWNILERVFATTVLLWCIAYLSGIPVLGVLQNPLGAPLQLTILESFLAIPNSVAGYFFGRRSLHRAKTMGFFRLSKSRAPAMLLFIQCARIHCERYLTFKLKSEVQ